MYEYQESIMTGTCENCGNHYHKLFAVIMNGREHLFDCFECAINHLAPHCANCETTIIGHGTEFGGEYYCCNHCLSHGTSHKLLDSERETDSHTPLQL